MGLMVVTGAVCTCTFGAAPCTLNVLPDKMVTAGGPFAANINDHIPYVNIPGFSPCSSIANPAVAAATAAALGVLTPSTCIPTLPSPWVAPAVTTTIRKMPAVIQSSILNCAYGGVITVSFPGQVVATAT
jgi:hypothetical protein